MTLVSLSAFRTKRHTQVSALDCFQSNNKKHCHVHFLVKQGSKNELHLDWCSLGVSFNCISDVSYRRPPGLFSVLLDPSVFTLQWSKTIDTEIIDTARSNPWNSPVSQTLFITDNYFTRRRNHQNSKMAKIFDCSKAEWGSESSSTVVRNHSYVKAEL